MVGVWVMVALQKLWQIKGNKDFKLNLIELGGGSGRLMFHIIRILNELKPGLHNINIQMIEVNPYLRLNQQKRITSFLNSINIYPVYDAEKNKLQGIDHFQCKEMSLTWFNTFKQFMEAETSKINKAVGIFL
jgi:SAM-dependent MidA family methyltransferase